MSKRNKLKGIATLGVTLGLASCATIPDLGSAPKPKAATDYAATQSFAAPGGDWPADGWWNAYGDPQLSSIDRRRLAGSPTMAQAQARVTKARPRRRGASGRLPTLEGDGSYAEVKESLNQGFPPQFAQYLPRGYNSSGYLALKFGYEFDFWGKNRAAIAAAIFRATRAAQADAAEARLALSTGWRLAYADLGRLFAERDVAERSVQNKEETAGLVLRRVENGVDTRAELKEAEAGAPAARAQLAAVDEEIAQTRNRIAALMGAGP
jgi:outer membrane protein TolC